MSGSECAPYRKLHIGGRHSCKTLNTETSHGSRRLRGFFLACNAFAGHVVVDNSFGHGGMLSGPNFAIGAGLGKRLGPNLFQSFSTFNLDKGDVATFTAPANVHNILARVTGGSASNIDGTHCDASR